MSFALQNPMRAAPAPHLGVLSIAAIVLATAVGAGYSVLQEPAQRPAPAARVGEPTPAVTITDPTKLPRLTFEDLKYEGAFRLPAEDVNDAGFSFGGGPLAYDPERDSLFVGTRGGRIAEVSIPSPVSSGDATQLPFAK